jgi:hypothetical protein
MSLHSRDQDLLLLAHRALPLGRKLWVQAHVAICAPCAARLTQLGEASSQTAAALRGSQLPSWSRPYTNSALATARIATAWLAAFWILLVLSVVVISREAHLHREKQTLPTIDNGCRPNLPNDKCR